MVWGCISARDVGLFKINGIVEIEKYRLVLRHFQHNDEPIHTAANAVKAYLDRKHIGALSVVDWPLQTPILLKTTERNDENGCLRKFRPC